MQRAHALSTCRAATGGFGAAPNPMAGQWHTIGAISELGLLDVDDIVDSAVGQAVPAEYANWMMWLVHKRIWQ
jgi:hypothetical protein